MRDRLSYAAVASALVATLALLVTSAFAEPAFRAILPLLVDLPGWTGAKADGMTMETGDSGAFTTASRKYTKGPASLEVAIMSGPAAAGAIAPVRSGMKFETTDGHMLPVEISGYKAIETYNTKDKSGAVIVALGDKVAFMLNYRGAAEDEAVDLAKRFDWKAIQSAANAK